MADRLKDETDLKLEALFRTEPVPDAGFAARIESRVRRQIWVQRLSLPIALIVGALLAAKPLMQVFGLLPQLFGQVPQSLAGIGSLFDLRLDSLPAASTISIALVLFAATLLIGRVLEE